MSIKVGTAQTAKSVDRTRKSGTTAAGESGFSSFLQEPEDAVSPYVSASNAVSGIQALLATQSVEDATQCSYKKRRAAERGNHILDELEELRAALLSGMIPKAKLIELARVLREKRETGLDDELNRILDEIELRAEVELAKLADSV